MIAQDVNAMVRVPGRAAWDEVETTGGDLVGKVATALGHPLRVPFIDALRDGSARLRWSSLLAAVTVGKLLGDRDQTQAGTVTVVHGTSAGRRPTETPPLSLRRRLRIWSGCSCSMRAVRGRVAAHAVNLRPPDAVRRGVPDTSSVQVRSANIEYRLGFWSPAKLLVKPGLTTQ